MSSRELSVQCSCQGFLLALAFHLLQVKSILGAGVVDATLGLLLTLPATRALVLVVSNGLGRVPVTNALVATVQQLVVRDVVLLDVLLDLVEGPVGHRVDLDQTSLVNLDDVEVTSLATLAAAATSEDGVDVELAVGTLSRLNLGNPVVESVISLPQTGAVPRLKFGGSLSVDRLVDMHIVQRVTLADPVNQVVGLFKVVKGVQKDEVNHLRAGDIQLGQHIQGDQASQAEGSGLEEMRQ